MLTFYQTALQSLIQAPNSLTPLVSTATLTTNINTARNQLAAEAECIRVTGSFTLDVHNSSYPFSAILVPFGVGNGAVITVRAGLMNGVPIEVRPWEWFQQYYLGSNASGRPSVMAQQGQGTSGTLYFWPSPNDGLSNAQLDVCCLPIPLVDDTTKEAIPPLWQDAVPFYAAWLTMQALQRQADAEMMLARYEKLVRRGRQLATPSELPEYLPGGAGTAMAAAKTTLGGVPPQPDRGR